MLGINSRFALNARGWNLFSLYFFGIIPDFFCCLLKVYGFFPTLHAMDDDLNGHYE